MDTQPPPSSSCFYWIEIRDMNQFEVVMHHNFVFPSLGWLSANSLYICTWPFDQCIGESTWLPLDCNHRWIIVCQWPIALISCFKYLHHVHNLQRFVWVWWQLPFRFILCYNITVLWKVSLYSNWHFSVWNRTWCSFCCTNPTSLTGLLWLEKDLPYNCCPGSFQLFAFCARHLIPL